MKLVYYRSLLIICSLLLPKINLMLANETVGSFVTKIKQLQEEENRYIPDTKRKSAECIELVERGAKFLTTDDFETVCNAFMYKAEWRKGEIFNFLIDEAGFILCHGDNTELIWKNINFARNFIGEPIFKTFQQMTSLKGEWLFYRWNNGFKAAYVRKIILNNNIYYLGAGFFPQSKEYIAEQLVKTAIMYFKQTPSQVVFTRISNPNDIFVFGDVSMYVLDFQGNMVADATDLGFIRQNIIDLQDSAGHYIIRNIIDQMKRSKSAWLKEVWLNNQQTNYVEKTEDPRDNKEYIFAAGYYPDINEVSAAELLEKSIAHIRSVGTKKAFSDFSNPAGKFVNGRLTIAVYDFEGKNLANSEYPMLIGQDLINRKDPDGKFIVKDSIQIARDKGEGIITTLNKNSYEKLFIKRVDTPEGKFIITVGTYIQSKAITAESLVHKAVRYIKSNSLVETLKEITNPLGQFYYGDIYLFAYNAQGILVANGEYKNMIWEDNKKYKDEAGQQIIEKILAIAKNGGGWFVYPTRHSQRRVYIKPVVLVDKNTKKKELLILGSGYFL